ncbi:MAG: hypothetical protein HZB54_01305 [Deltaproteobacteria bacterium]|nr:hypothetical protein [Deltaproteobacteria bacterium]
MPSIKNNNQKLDKSLEQIIKERFVHSLSNIVYDKVATLWHIDKESEKFMARMAVNVVVGIFCLEYLSHINSLIREKAKIKENITAIDLSDEDLMAKVKTIISHNEEAESIFKNAASRLKEIIDSVDIKTLEDLTKIAHTGDYLLSSLQDMKDSSHSEYAIWLSSIPHYYEKDLKHLGLIKTARGEWNNYTEPFWSEQSLSELFHFEKIHSDHRINLNAQLVPETAKEGYFPCTRANPTEGNRLLKGKNKRIYSDPVRKLTSKKPNSSDDKAVALSSRPSDRARIRS